MILILKEKFFKSNLSTLIYPKDYIIVDATDDDTAEMGRKYSNCISLDAIAPPNKCVKSKLSNDDSCYDYDVLDEDKLEKAEKKWKNGAEFEKAVTAVVDTFMSKGQINVFIVMKKKAYDAYANTIKKKIQGMFTDESTPKIKFVYTQDEYKDDTKCLKRDLKGDDVDIVKRGLDARRELIKEAEREDEKHRRHKGKKARQRYLDEDDD